MSLTTRALTGIVVACFISTSLGAQSERPTDQWVTRPVDGRTFQTYLEFFSYESSLPLDLSVTSSHVVDGLLEERLTFQSTPGMTVTARTYRPNAGVSLGGLVLVHGGTPNGKDGQNLVRRTRVLARAGWTVLAIDMLYFGERDTGLFKTFGAQEKVDKLYNRQSLYLEFVIQTVKDIGRAHDVLIEEYDVPTNRVGLVGFSRGAQLSMIAGGADGRFAAVALLHGGHFDALENGHRPAACGANYIGRINPRPLFMMNGEADMDYIPEVAVRPMQLLLGPESTIRWTDGGHGVTTEEDLNVLVDWLRRELSQ